MVDHRETRRREVAQEPATTGTPSQGRELEFLAIGQIVGPRGVRGELKVNILTEVPERFYDLRQVYLGEDHVLFAVRGVQLHLEKNQALLRLQGIRDRNAAEAWRGAYIYVHIQDALPLEEGQYYYHQLEGLTVVTEEGEPIGRLVEILPTGANDVYVIDGPRGELLLPAISTVVQRIDLEEGCIVVRIPEGL
ncbi:MAG: 16S rRNA processing protein RimM, partial [Chloroflexi bacterium]|nr:16S rRNA processing protein RimM [Chloroflexota bacterium]